MKAIIDLAKAITDVEYYDEQLSLYGTEKNILFVEPQLTSKHLYKYILPFFSLIDEGKWTLWCQPSTSNDSYVERETFYVEKMAKDMAEKYRKNSFNVDIQHKKETRVATAITGLTKYAPFEQLVGIKQLPTEKQILWADFIVFPFTTMDLSKDFGIYQAIREVKPNCQIVFSVDWDYYNMPIDHPHKELFDFPTVIDSVERNILFSDLCLSSNIMLCNWLVKKFTELADTKYRLLEDIPVNFGAIPYLIDEEIVLQNVEFESQKPASVINKEIFKKISEIAEEIKKEDLSVTRRRQKPKGRKVKTTKVVANKKGKAPVKVKGKEVLNLEEITKVEHPKLPRAYRVGIIYSPNNCGDIKYYNDEFKKINEMYGEDVTLIFVGYDYEDDKNKILDGVNFEYVGEVSIKHFPQQLKDLDLDLVFIPLRKNDFNIRSENINKYEECGLRTLSVIVEDMFPYNNIILSETNGFLYKGKEAFIGALDKVLRNPDLIKNVVVSSRLDTIKSYSYTENNKELMSSIYV